MKLALLLIVAIVGVVLAYLSRRSGDGTVVAGYEGYQGRPMRVRSRLERTIGKTQTQLYDRLKRALGLATPRPASEQ